MLKKAAMATKSGKIAGHYKINTEMIRNNRAKGMQFLLYIMCTALKVETILITRKNVLRFHCLKKMAKKCKNQRGITVKCTAMKIYIVYVASHISMKYRTSI